MKRIIVILFMIIAISCYSQSVDFEFNTVSVIERETSMVKSTIHQMSKFIITETAIYLRTELSSNKFEIERVSKVKYIDNKECLTIKTRGYYLEGIIVIKSAPLNGIYLIYKDKIVRYYNT